MPAIRDHDIVFNDLDDDDDMPPLVDNPNPSMTFTFFTDMTPITAFSTDPTSVDSTFDNATPTSPLDSAEYIEYPAAAQGGGRTSHSKKRDASYIPRPPNAFILFRSSFIRSQQVPGKVEGNHSALSKIIGMYWKTLPREEREIWEAKAVVAQSEHRKRYPDWRFRPGANALAKLKVKDGPGTARKKNSPSLKKKSEAVVKERHKEERCAKIADLLVAGKKGIDLEAAVKKWEHDAGQDSGLTFATEINEMDEGGRTKAIAGELSDSLAVQRKKSFRPVQDPNLSNLFIGSGQHKTAEGDKEETLRKARCKTPSTMDDSRFKVPLTAMFKRSLSAPAAGQKCFSPHSCVDAASLLPIISSPPGAEDQESRDVANESNDCLSPLMLSSVFGDTSPMLWTSDFHQTSNSLDIATYQPHSPPFPSVGNPFSAYESIPLKDFAGDISLKMACDIAQEDTMSYSPDLYVHGLSDLNNGWHILPEHQSSLSSFTGLNSPVIGSSIDFLSPTSYDWSRVSFAPYTHRCDLQAQEHYLSIPDPLTSGPFRSEGANGCLSAYF